MRIFILYVADGGEHDGSKQQAIVEIAGEDIEVDNDSDTVNAIVQLLNPPANPSSLFVIDLEDDDIQRFTVTDGPECDEVPARFYTYTGSDAKVS